MLLVAIAAAAAAAATGRPAAWCPMWKIYVASWSMWSSLAWGIFRALQVANNVIVVAAVLLVVVVAATVAA